MELQATIFYLSYIEDKDVNMFVTGSLAEYHEFNLGHLLSNNIKLLSPPPSDLDHITILTDNSQFNTAVQRYKNIVTHYLACKMEIWMTLFLRPVYGIESGSLSFEFAKSRGCIHYHATMHSENNCMKKIIQSLKTLSIKISESIAQIRMHVRDQYSNSVHGEQGFSIQPDLVYTKDGSENLKRFCSFTDIGTQLWLEYELSVAQYTKECSCKIGLSLKKFFGLHAMHTGNLPDNWVKPGGAPESSYQLSCERMQSSKNVLDSEELKKPKWTRRTILYWQHSNITNHCHTHK